MKVVSNLDALELRHAVLCIGNFDGVHLGHQMLLKHLRFVADTQQTPSIIITFFPPSKVVFGRGFYLTSKEEKLQLMAAYDPDAVVVIPFDLDYAKTDKQVFMDQLEALEPHTIIVGEDFRFGHKRSGSLNDLSHIPQRLEVFGIKELDDEPIKSSRIREHLEAGNIEAANRLLGHSYIATGTVTEGEKRGHSIGFPTANVNLPSQKALPVGVFAVRVQALNRHFNGMANVGPRPSYPNAAPSFEVHLFNFDDDLYQQSITVSFEHFLRGQKKFSGLEELKAQLQRDREAALELLSS